MSAHTFYKYCLYIISLAGFALTMPVSAQPERLPKPQETQQCGDESASRYDMWVKDLPCVPVLSESDLTPVAPEPLGKPLLQLDEEPNAGNYTHVVFSRYIDGNWEIYAAHSPWDYDGIRYAERKTYDPASDLRPRLRPGDTQIIFASDRTGNYELYLMAWDGTMIQQLTWSEGYDSQAAWSPDGRRLAYVTELDGNQEIAVMQADGSGWTRLTKDSADDFNPSWSPDGTKLIWVKAYDAYHGVIYTMKADGSEQQPLTYPLLYVQHPYWSLDGTQISFDYDHNQDYWFDLVKMNLDGSGLSVLRGGYSFYDYNAGTWIRTDDRDMLYTEYNYYEWDGEIYLSDICIGAYSISSGGGACFQYSHLDMYPDAASTDISVPETHFLPLPEYSRAGDIDLTLTGYDPGPAGLFAVRVENRLGADGEWQYWRDVGYQPTMYLTYTVQAGDTVFFRSAGWDMAEHWEPFEEGDGDTHTTAYAWQLHGQVVDNRGLGIPNASIMTVPVFNDQRDANLDGEFHRFVPADTVNVTIFGSGYFGMDDSVISSSVDVHVPWALRPFDDNLINGGFESGLDWWFNSSEQDAYLDEDINHAGQASAAVGLNGLGSGAENISNNTDMSFYVDAILDTQGTLHAVWGDSEGAYVGTIYYAQKPLAGDWSEPLAVNPGHTKSSWQPDLALGPDDSLHVVWMDSDYEGAYFYYAHRDAGGTWSAVEDISGERFVWEPKEMSNPEIEVDSLSTVHVIFADQEGLWYINHPESGEWSEPHKIIYSYGAHAMQIDGSNTLHFVYSAEEINYLTRMADGNWSDPEVITYEQTYGLKFDLDPSGNVHVVWLKTTGDGAIYTKRTAPGEWSPSMPLVIDNIAWEYQVVVEDGLVHFMWYGNDGALKYRRQFTEDVWSDPILVADPELGFDNGLSMIVKDDIVYAFWCEFVNIDDLTSDLMFTEWELGQNARTSLSHRGTLVDNLNNPTLSFHTYAQQVGTGGSFSVQVNDTTVFTSDGLLPAWEHTWIDMSAWQGQVVTVTFSVDNDLSQGMLQVNLDDVSLGSWNTPVVVDVTPGTFEEWSSMLLTITGDNFMESPFVSVRIGETEVNNVIRIDEHTLQVEIPSGLAPGIYSVWVVNAGEWFGAWKEYLQVGDLQFMPCLLK